MVLNILEDRTVKKVENSNVQYLEDSTVQYTVPKL